MSRQEMNYEEVKPNPPGTGYTSMSYDYSTGSYGQKISDRTSSKVPTTGQRLAMAIVSQAMLTVMALALLVIGKMTYISGPGAAILVFVFLMFLVAVIIINVLFNRK